MTMCAKCNLNPCACRWIIQLGQGAQQHQRAEAVRMWKLPLPVIDGKQTYHYPTCCCPKCHSLRLGSFDGYPNVVPFPPPPDKSAYDQPKEHDEST